MTTAIDIIIGARQRLRIHADEEPMEAHELAKGMNALSDMLAAWKLDRSIADFTIGEPSDSVSVEVRGVPDPSTPNVAPANVVLSNEASLALKDNLALMLSEDYGVPVSPDVYERAISGRDTITGLGLSNTDNKSQFDRSLQWMPSQRRGTWQ